MQNEVKVQVLETISQAFAPIDQASWDELTSFASWTHFLDGCTSAVCVDAGNRSDLADYLESTELEALNEPPTFLQKQHFAARHFTGGLPQSAMPVESLYRDKDGEAVLRNPLVDEPRHYGGPSASYMEDLVRSLGCTMPQEFKAYPDHLALEADLAAFLYRSGMQQQAESFIEERFAWLTVYRMRLLSLEDEEARFYMALLDVLVGLSAALADERDWDEASSATYHREEKSCQKTQ